MTDVEHIRAEIIEVMGRAMYESIETAPGMPLIPWEKAPESYRRHWRRQAERGVDAALSVPSWVDCKTCGGKRLDRGSATHPWCSTCGGSGRVPGGYPAILDLIRQSD